MVFGRLLRVVGLGKPQAVPEEQFDTTPASVEASITDNAYSKMMLMQFRMVANGQDADEDAPNLLTATDEFVLDSDRKVCSPKTSPKSIDSTPTSRLDPLMPTAGSWSASMQNKRSVKTDVDDDNGQVSRKACLILNKLTVEKFDSLFEQLATCGITKPVHLEMLMREVFNKATTQHHFIAMYADLCVRLDQDSRISSAVQAAGQQHSFRRLLLNQCQVSFEQLLQSAEAPQDANKCADDEEAALKRKQQALGNIKLIGQLLVRGIVSSKLLVECSEELLRSRDSCPEALESLAALVTVAGKQFDTQSWPYHARFVEVFSCMRKLWKDKSTPPRVRFLLRDVLDVREAGWSHCTYSATLAAAPMKLEEVRGSAANEGKYMSLEDQIETDTLLAGLMNVSLKANAQKKKDFTHSPPSPMANAQMKKKEGPHYSLDSTPIHTNSGKHSKIADRPWKQEAARKQEADFAPWKQEAARKPEAASPKVDLHWSDIQPGNPPDPVPVSAPNPFDVVAFRRALAATLTDLASDKKVPAAVRRIRVQEVPLEFQAKEFADIITRITEERRGPVRRCGLTFAAALGASEESAFDRTECLTGIGLFFGEVYPELCKEIPRLPAVAASEVLPTLRNVFSKDELDEYIPKSLA